MPSNARDLILSWFKEHGFDRAGCARVSSVNASTKAAYLSWLDRGYQASMGYMTRNVDKRLDPCLLLPGAKSVLVGLSNYCTPGRPPSNQPGKVAMYAGQRDYHKTLKKGLKKIADRIRAEFPEADTWIGVDTAPLLERYWAQQAGLGWIGKNTLLINRSLGSWTFIGCLLTTLEIEPDPPYGDYCGSCTRCLSACPTGAFVEPHVLDSRKCISYWTIEHRGEFEQNTFPGTHGWIFGCDDCQTVCPWNRFANPTGQPDFQPIPWTRPPRLLEWLQWTPEEWEQAVTGTALRRTGYEGFRRNCQSVLDQAGTSSQPEATTA
ncbi:MAG: tRNA epoxyqueuosine(34) reductase QueG [Candidatus Omnitrophica bacterium]|nr:Epoxyqueuosine reductase [bacterium]MCC6734236.1 tRNA epoxyqueuosine(34) reductase QueG [Candidatus Omnitrophota bacterium]